MTRFAIDATTAVRLVRDAIVIADHQLVAPAVMRSQALSLLYRATRAGDIGEVATYEALTA